MTLVGSYEAKTHLPGLLERVARGEQITITKHGVPVARLVPITASEAAQRQGHIAELKSFRHGRRLNGVSLRQMIEEGRR